jgi:hypothetical protein
MEEDRAEAFGCYQPGCDRRYSPKGYSYVRSKEGSFEIAGFGITLERH